MLSIVKDLIRPSNVPCLGYLNSSVDCNKSPNPFLPCLGEDSLISHWFDFEPMVEQQHLLSSSKYQSIRAGEYIDEIFLKKNNNFKKDWILMTK